MTAHKWLLIIATSAVLLVVVGVMALSISSNFLRSKKNDETRKVADASVAFSTTAMATAQQLVIEYATNGVSADSKYKNKPIVATGVIHEVAIGSVAAPYVALAPSVFDSATLVHAAIHKDSLSRVANLTLFSEAWLLCIGDGVTLKMPKLRDCQLISTAPISPARAVAPDSQVSASMPASALKPAKREECIRQQLAAMEKQRDAEVIAWCAELAKKNEECRISAGQDEMVRQIALERVAATCH